MIFRIYIEALWYPGRNMNVMNVMQTTHMRGNPEPEMVMTTSSDKLNVSSSKKTMTENNMPIDVVEPPKFITGRHVAAVFEKLGYDQAAGQKVFTILCEILSHQNSTKLKESRANLSTGKLGPQEYDDDERPSQGSSDTDNSPQD
eukprot:gene43300-53758_t